MSELQEEPKEVHQLQEEHTKATGEEREPQEQLESERGAAAYKTKFSARGEIAPPSKIAPPASAKDIYRHPYRNFYLNSERCGGVKSTEGEGHAQGIRPTG